jgi:hypothetical protein
VQRCGIGTATELTDTSPIDCNDQVPSASCVSLARKDPVGEGEVQPHIVALHKRARIDGTKLEEDDAAVSQEAFAPVDPLVHDQQDEEPAASATPYAWRGSSRLAALRCRNRDTASRHRPVTARCRTWSAG